MVGGTLSRTVPPASVGTTASPQFGSSPDFGELPLFLSRYNGGDSDAFVTKLNTKATRLLYFRYIGGKKTDFGRGICVVVAHRPSALAAGVYAPGQNVVND